MSQSGPPERSKKRKLKHSKPLLEQIPSLPPSSDKQQKQQHKRHQQQQQPEQQQQQDALSAGNSKFARALGSTDFHTREQGLQALSRWLTHKSVSELDMLKLWKGIYFCFWHSDKEPVQEDLAERLAGLIPRMQPGMAVLYWAGMLATLRSEWFALDRHRLNKFLMLVRKFVAALFKRLAAEDWSVETIQTFTGNLPMVADIIPTSSSSSNTSSLGTEARQITRSLGLSYHLADVWLPELRKVAGEAPLPPEGLAALLEPFVGVLQHSGEAALINRVREAVFEALVQDVAAAAAAAASVEDSSSDSDDEDMDVSDLSAWAYCAALDPAGYAALLFDRGAQQGVRARNREALYGLSKDLERGAGKKRKAGGAGAAAPVAAGAAAAAAAPAGKQQVQHKQSKKEQQQQQGEQEHSVQKKHKQQVVEKQQQQQQQQETANGHVAKPPSAKKQKRQQQEAEAAAAAAAAAGTPGSSSGRKSSSKQQKQQAAAAAAAGGAGGIEAGTPAAAARGRAVSTAAAAAAAAASASESAAKRGVKIDLKKNLYFEHGAPPPAADIRTPPKAKPKGSALKTAAVKLDDKGRPASDGKQQQQQSSAARRKLVTPSSVPRLRAAEFF